MDIEIKAGDMLWLAGSIALLAWSVRKVGRRFLKGDGAPYVRMALRSFGLAMFAGGLWGHWIGFTALMRPERFWTAMIVNMPNLFTFSLWASVAFGLGLAKLYPNRFDR
jgi:hypothetical protein